MAAAAALLSSCSFAVEELGGFLGKELLREEKLQREKTQEGLENVGDSSSGVE